MSFLHECIGNCRPRSLSPYNRLVQGGCASVGVERMVVATMVIKAGRTRERGEDRETSRCCLPGGYLCRLILKLDMEYTLGER